MPKNLPRAAEMVVSVATTAVDSEVNHRKVSTDQGITGWGGKIVPRRTACLVLGIILIVISTAAVDFHNPNLQAFLTSSTAEEHKIEVSVSSKQEGDTDRILERDEPPTRSDTTDGPTTRASTASPSSPPTNRPRALQPTFQPTEPMPATRKDRCGFQQPESRKSRKDIQWISYNSTLVSDEQKTYFYRVHTCALRFKETHAEPIQRDFYVRRLKRTMETLLCDMTVDHRTLLSLVKQHGNILFAGDSVLRQQYFVLVCMINPEARETDWSRWEPLSHDSHFVYHYYHSASERNSSLAEIGISGTSNATQNGINLAKRRMTTITFEPIGRRWNRRQVNLWTTVFPYAVGNFSQDDAIVMDSSRHYDSNVVNLYEKALVHTIDQATKAKATIYYMEPTPQEWPTSNGFYPDSCHRVCHCRALAKEQLDGWAVPWDPNLDFTRNTTRGKLPVPSFTFFEKLYGPQARTFTTDVAEDDQTCFPDCVPATWRVDFVRAMLQNMTTTTTAPPVERLKLVPTFWQLVAMNHPSAKALVGDCTHRSMDAVVFMNEQLVRSMMLQREKMQMDRLTAMRSP